MSEHALAGSSLMQKYLAALTIVLLLGMVLIRVFVMRRTGTKAMHFGKIDKTDFLIPPFALFYFYTLFAAALILPLRSNFLGWSNPLPRGLNTSTPKSDFFWQEFSRWYRCRPFRQTCNDRRICFQPQS